MIADNNNSTSSRTMPIVVDVALCTPLSLVEIYAPAACVHARTLNRRGTKPNGT